jgi:hypothetical protein
MCCPPNLLQFENFDTTVVKQKQEHEAAMAMSTMTIEELRAAVAKSEKDKMELVSAVLLRFVPFDRYSSSDSSNMCVCIWGGGCNAGIAYGTHDVGKQQLPGIASPYCTKLSMCSECLLDSGLM